MAEVLIHGTDQCFVDHFHGMNTLAVPLGDLPDPLLQQVFDVRNVMWVHPGRRPLIVVQAMQPGNNVVTLAELHAEIDRRTAVSFGGIFGKARFPGLRFEIGPKEGERCVIGRARKIFLELLVLFLRFHFIQHKTVGPMQKFMPPEIVPDSDSGNRIPASVLDRKDAPSFTVLFNSFGNTGFRPVSIFLKFLQHLLCPVHRFILPCLIVGARFLCHRTSGISMSAFHIRSISRTELYDPTYRAIVDMRKRVL